jgi:hypothetical protein
MPSSPGEIDWEQLKQEAPASTRVALDYLERLSQATAARIPRDVFDDEIPKASLVAMLVAAVATIRVVFGVALAVAFAPESTYAVPPWLISASAVVFFAGGIVLWVGGERDWRARHLGLAYLTIAAAFTNPRHLGWIVDNASTTVSSTAYALRALATESFIPFFVLAFFTTFPRIPADIWIQRVLLSLKHAALWLGIALALVNVAAWLWPLWVGIPAPAERLRSWLPVTEPPAYFWIAVFVVVAPALLLAVAKTRRSRGTERQRGMLLLGGVVFAVTPFCLALVLLNTTGLRSNPERLRTAAAIVYGALLTLPVTTAYAVLTRGALDVRVLVRNAAHHALARWVLSTATIAPLAVTLALIWDYRTRTLESLLEMPMARVLLGTAAVGLILMLVRGRVLAGIDRLFLRSVVDPETLVADVGERARRMPSAHDVAADLVSTIQREFAVEHGAVLVREPAGTTFDALGANLPPLVPTSALVDLASTAEDVLTTEQPVPISGLLPIHDRQWLLHTGVEALVPLHGRGDRLIGVLALGHRRGDWTYTPRERRTLKAVVAAVAPVLERHLEATAVATVSSGSEDALLVCVDCGVIHPQGASRCPCGGAIEGGVIPRIVGGKYEVTRRLGRGAMGVVYEARDLALERAVAIKALPHLSYREGERLVQEARRMTRVTHPNLAAVFGLETFNTMPLVVMEYLAGRTLRDRIARGPLPLAEVTRIGVALCDALIRLHQSGLLHRDIKPGNVGFDAEGTPKLLDFGLALPVEISSSATVALAGTPLYLPPEAWSGHPADHHVDLWGLSMTLCEALLGSHPLSGISAEELETGGAAMAAEAVHRQPGADASAVHLFATALAADQAARFADAAHLRAALASLHPSTAGRMSGTTEQTA